MSFQLRLPSVIVWNCFTSIGSIGTKATRCTHLLYLKCERMVKVYNERSFFYGSMEKETVFSFKCSLMFASGVLKAQGASHNPNLI